MAGRSFGFLLLEYSILFCVALQTTQLQMQSIHKIEYRMSKRRSTKLDLVGLISIAIHRRLSFWGEGMAAVACRLLVRRCCDAPVA